MGLFPLPVETFGGLDLVDAPDEIGFSRAIDLLNVDFDQPGRARSRDGFAAFTASPLTNRTTSLLPYYAASGTKQLVAGSSTRLDSLNTSGTVVASQTGLSGSVFALVRIGGPGFEYVYASSANDRLHKWNGTTWATVTTVTDGVGGSLAPAGQCAAVQQPDNRFVIGGFVSTTDGPAGVTSTPSRIYFSAAGDPETWTSTDWVDLSPGDGETVTAIVGWRELLFVFKPSSFYVFYGNATDGTGRSVFNNRPVRGNVGCVSPRAVCVARDGVYFMDRKGIYLTTGGPAQPVSTTLDPFFRASLPSFFGSSACNQAQVALCALFAFNERIFASVPTGSATANDRTLVYDPRIQQWTLWDLPASCFSSFRIASDVDELVFGYASGPNHVGRYNVAAGYTQDGGDGKTTGAGITSRYQSGFDNIAPPRRFAAHYLFGNTRKRLRKWKLTGTGAVAFNVAHDFNAMVAGSSRNLTLGTSPAIKDGWYQVAKRGQLFSYRISDAAGAPWTVQKMTSYLAGAEPPLLGSPADQ